MLPLALLEQVDLLLVLGVRRLEAVDFDGLLSVRAAERAELLLQGLLLRLEHCDLLAVPGGARQSGVGGRSRWVQVLFTERLGVFQGPLRGVNCV